MLDDPHPAVRAFYQAEEERAAAAGLADAEGPRDDDVKRPGLAARDEPPKARAQAP